ncbi:MAG: rhodanese-like domain-containing protein [Gammaproteobacteria bacterium]|nr:rhodanese-like domain-containing protein [Gammaproteobacteria bacterium]
MIVAAFYRFLGLENLEALRSRLEGLAAGLGLKGTVLLAEEGINGGLRGSREALDAFMAALCEDRRFAGMPVRLSTAAPGNPVFNRLKVRIKPEIVSFGRPEVDPLKATGQRVGAAGWNALLDRPEVQVVDVRNAYETAIGGFPGALDPDTERFRDFPAFVEEALNPEAHPEVALYCTGGIRCEKASAYLLDRGFETVHQLDGGILNYLASVPAEESRWRGDCFVFDQRLALDGLLRPVAAETLVEAGSVG